MPHRLWDRNLLAAIASGVELPPVVVFRHNNNAGWGLLDGVNRTNAFVASGTETTLAYELLHPAPDWAKPQ
jgi:hypothetical protein